MIEQTFVVKGMTCEGCLNTVRELLMKVQGVGNVKIDLPTGFTTLSLNAKQNLAELQGALKNHPKYHIEESLNAIAPKDFIKDYSANFFQTYKPIVLIFGYILTTTLVVESIMGTFIIDRWMSHFMAGFFLVFSFFKMLNLKGFADSYADYDILARKWKPWAYIYAFMELGLGLGFLIGVYPLTINILTFLIMTISSIGVIRSLLKKETIQCACLGDIFNLPMSTVTLVEDGIMIFMSAWMVFRLL